MAGWTSALLNTIGRVPKRMWPIGAAVVAAGAAGCATTCVKGCSGGGATGIATGCVGRDCATGIGRAGAGATCAAGAGMRAMPRSCPGLCAAGAGMRAAGGLPGDTIVPGDAAATLALQRRVRHACRRTPLPPNTGMSTQLMHVPQLTELRQPGQRPHVAL